MGLKLIEVGLRWMRVGGGGTPGSEEEEEEGGERLVPLATDAVK